MMLILLGTVVAGVVILLATFLPRKAARLDADSNWEQRNDLRVTSLEESGSAPQSLGDIEVGLGSQHDGGR